MEPIEPPQPRKSVNKKLAMVIVAVILIVVGFVVAFVVFRKINFKKAPSESKEAAKINILNLAKKGDVKKVLITEDGATPSEIHLDRGQAVSFTNLTKKDLNINISNSSFNAGVPVKANYTTYSPILNLGGTYKFNDSKNANISGQIIVSGSTSDAPDSSKFPVVSIHITKDGFKPSELKVKKNVLVRFLNETTSEAEVISSGPLLFGSGVIKPGLKWETSFSEPASVSYQLRSDPSKKGVLIVE